MYSGKGSSKTEDERIVDSVVIRSICTRNERENFGRGLRHCGREADDAVKLKHCTACRLVRYCGVDCQRAHRKQHKKACKKRAAELKDEQLYCQGHRRHEGDFCSICTLPIPLPTGDHSVHEVCRIKRIFNLSSQ